MLQRDGFQCRIAIAGLCLTQATQAHHVLGKARTGDNPDYMVAACGPCNRRIGDPTETPDPVGLPWK